MTTIYPAQLRAGDRMSVDGTFYEVESFRDSVVNSRTGDRDVAIEFKGEDWVQIPPRHESVQIASDNGVECKYSEAN